MHDNSTKKYKIEDLPTFFDGISAEISKAFSDKEIEISTICSQLISDKSEEEQEFSFKLKLLEEDQRAAVQSKDEKDQRAAVRKKTGSVIEFFKICLKDKKKIRSELGVSQEDKELKEKYTGNKTTLYKYIKCIPIAAISRGITIKLYADVGNIDLDKLDKLKSSLDEKLLLATENKQTVPTNNSINGTLTKIVAPSSQPTITPATEEVQTYTANVQQSVDAILDSEANRQELEAKATRIMEGYIMQAESAAMVDFLGIKLISPQKETLDKIFIAIVRKYTTQYEKWVKGQVEEQAKERVEKVFNSIFDSVFDIGYLQDKTLDKNEKKLELLEKLRADNKSPENEEYFQTAVYNKWKELRNLIRPVQPEPDRSLKSPLRNILSSKDTYFYLFAITTSTSALCLLHFTALGKSVMSEESTGLILNTALLILIAMCIIGLAYVAYSEYTVESVEQIDISNFQER